MRPCSSDDEQADAIQAIGDCNLGEPLNRWKSCTYFLHASEVSSDSIMLLIARIVACYNKIISGTSLYI